MLKARALFLAGVRLLGVYFVISAIMSAPVALSFLTLESATDSTRLIGLALVQFSLGIAVGLVLISTSGWLTNRLFEGGADDTAEPLPAASGVQLIGLLVSGLSVQGLAEAVISGFAIHSSWVFFLPQIVGHGTAILLGLVVVAHGPGIARWMAAR